jgi:hypothetical protein
VNAGLPGIGISGVFYIVSALVMPFVEAVRAVRGRRRRPWPTILSHWVVAAGMIAAMYGAGRLMVFVLRATGHRIADGNIWGTVLVSIAPFVIVLAAVELVTVLRRR